MSNSPDEMVLRKHKLTKLSDLLCSNDNNNLNECGNHNVREGSDISAAYERSRQIAGAGLANLSPVASAALSHSAPLSSKRKAMLLGPSPALTISKTEAATETGSCIEGSASVPAPSSNDNNGNGNGSGSGSRKVFECDVCNMIFSNGANMRRHRMRHTGVKPYECRICQKRFFRKDHLAEHFTTHTKTLPFHCPICDRGFQRQIAMRAHFQNEHVGQHDLVKSCPLCTYHANSMKGLRVHFFNRHGVDLDNPGPHSSLLTPAATLSLSAGYNSKRNSVSSFSELLVNNNYTSTLCNPDSVNMSSMSATNNYQLSVFNGNNLNNNNDDEEGEEEEDDAVDRGGERVGAGEEEADVDGHGDGDADADADADDDGDAESDFMSSKITSNRSVSDSISITLSKATIWSESQNQSDSGDSHYGRGAGNQEGARRSGHRTTYESKERRSMENATPPMHFLTPQVEISMASDDLEAQNADNQYNDLDNYQENDQGHEHDNGSRSDKSTANSNEYPRREQAKQPNEFKSRPKTEPSPSLFLQQMLAEHSNPLFHDQTIAALSTSSAAAGCNNLNNTTIIPSISLIPIKQEAISCAEDNQSTEQVSAKTFVSNISTNVKVTSTAATATATATADADAAPTLSSYGESAQKRLSSAVPATAVASHPGNVTTSAACTATSAVTTAAATATATTTAASTIPSTKCAASTDAVSISPIFSFIHTTSNSSGSGGTVGVRDAGQSSSLSSLMKVSPLKSLLKDELKRKPAYSVNTTSRTVNMYSGGSTIGQSNNQTMIVWPNFSKTKVPETTTQPHNLQQAISEMKCLYCGIFFPDQTLYFLHIGCHSESNPWKCNICGEQCSNIYEFNSHLLSKSH